MHQLNRIRTFYDTDYRLIIFSSHYVFSLYKNRHAYIHIYVFPYKPITSLHNTVFRIKFFNSINLCISDKLYFFTKLFSIHSDKYAFINEDTNEDRFEFMIFLFSRFRLLFFANGFFRHFSSSLRFTTSQHRHNGL